ncbi:carbohydrate-binding family 9-like protein [soil metagenome]
MYIKHLIFLFLPLISYFSLAQIPALPFEPEHYICYQTQKPLLIDGILTDEEWDKVPWTKDFVDIEGELKPNPRFRTRVKMLWDDQYFYIAAELEEPHIWATLKERDTVIFQDHDFEVFIDPSGDTHNYYEFEVNALGTEWDLLLTKPYRDGGLAIYSWDIKGIKVGIDIDGTLNDPSDKDNKWTIEIALPWAVLKECAPERRKPEAGNQWRVNFSRVEWKTEINNGKYRKIINPVTGKSYPEDNWVWSPQGIINMHYPETWGFVQFSGHKAGEGEEEFVFNENEKIKWALRQIYYAQKQFFSKNNKFAENLSELEYRKITINNYHFSPILKTTHNLYEVSCQSIDGLSTWFIRQDGFIWKK